MKTPTHKHTHTLTCTRTHTHTLTSTQTRKKNQTHDLYINIRTYYHLSFVTYITHIQTNIIHSINAYTHKLTNKWYIFKLTTSCTLILA